MISLTTIKERLKTPKHKGSLATAANQESRIRFHSKIELSKAESERSASDFFGFVKKVIPYDKYLTLKEFFQYPADTIPLSDEIYSALEKVFDGRNPVFHYEFKNEDDAADWNVYRIEALGEPDVWKTKAFEVMKTAINSVMVVDFASELTDTPEPYFYFIPVDSIIDIEFVGDHIEWIMFKQSPERLAVYDDEFYRVYEFDGAEIKSDTPLVQNPHDIGYCPARFFWSDRINVSNPIVKRSPLSPQITALNKLLFKILSKDYADLYAAYPILWGFKQDCSFEDESGNYCSDGLLRTKDDRNIMVGDGQYKLCPSCSASRFAGPGSFVTIDPPESPEDANLREPVGIIPAEVNSLKYNEDQIKATKIKIYEAVTGNSIELIKDQAINEDQVKSLLESRKAVLLKLKTQFEIAQTWVDSTICRIRYRESFVRANINYGDEFYLFSADQYLALYQNAIKGNLDHQVLDLLQDNFYSTKFRHDSIELQRSFIIRHVAPFNHVALSTVSDLHSKQLVASEEYLVKVNFSSLLQKFERENGSIVYFGLNLPFEKKVETIKSALVSYIQVPSN